MPRRLGGALGEEQRIVPFLLLTEQRDAILQGQRPPIIRDIALPTPAAPKKKKPAPSTQVKREIPASVLKEQEAEAAAKKKPKKAPPVPFK